MITVFAIAVSGWLAVSKTQAPIQPSDSANVVQAVSRFHAALAAGDSAAVLGLLDRDAIILEHRARTHRAEANSPSSD